MWLLRAILKRLRAIYKYMGTLFNLKRISKLLLCGKDVDNFF